MWFIARVLVWLSLASSLAFAGRGGHSTTYDPNLWPGANYTTINCTGVQATDDTSFSNWNTAAVAANPQTAVLRLTGSGCNPTSGKITNGIAHAVIWAYGTPFLSLPYMGGSPTFGTVADPNGDLLASNASAGATSVTLATPAAASNYTVGQYAAVIGINPEAFDCGFPPGNRFYDYVLVLSANSSTGVITFSPPLSYNYLTTWPSVCTLGPGPAAIVPMHANWNGTLAIYGLNANNATACGQLIVTMRVAYVLDSVFSNPTTCPVGNVGMDPTVSQSMFVGFSDVGSSEVDKLIDNFVIDHSYGSHIFVQTSNIKNMNVSNTTLTGAFTGTSGNSKFINSKFSQLWIGPDGPGATSLSDNSLLLDHVTVPTAVVYFSFVPISATTFSGGVLSVPLTSGSISVFLHVAVPGAKFALGENGQVGSPVQAFTITAVSSDGTNLNMATDIVGSFPTSNCGVPACTQIVAYPAPKNGITQINNPAGTPDFTQYAAPN